MGMIRPSLSFCSLSLSLLIILDCTEINDNIFLLILQFSQPNQHLKTMAFFDIESDEFEEMMEQSESDVAEYRGCEAVVRKSERLSSTWYK